jgi:hypothetical protein
MTTVIHLIYVDPVEAGWRVSGEERGETWGTFPEKEAAVAAARALAKDMKGQLIVRTADQNVEFAEDYASVEDPLPLGADTERREVPVEE